MTNLDVIITLGTIGIFAYVVWRKRKKKKAETESEKIQTSESTVLSLPFGCPNVERDNVDFATVNFRNSHSGFDLETEIETRVNRMIVNAENNDRIPFIQYVPVGTTLLIVCVSVRNNS